MQISQTRTKAQTKSMAVYFSGLACFLLAQAWMVEAVSPFAAAYCTALFLQKRKGYMACLGTILGALVQYPALPMMTIAIPAGLFIVVGLGEIYQQATSRTLVLGTVLTAGAVSWWVFQRDTVFAMIAGGINLLLVCLFAILFEGLCRVKEDMAQKETLDDAEKLALAVLASGLLMGVGKWTFCGLNLFFCLSFTLTLYTAYYLQPSLAASFGLWTGFCGLLCGALMPIMIDWRICLCVRQPCQQKNGHTELFAELYYAGFADASDAGGPFVDRGSDRNGDDICPASKMGHEMGLSAETEKKTRGKAEAGDDAAADKQAIELFVRGVVAHGAADETDKPWTGERNGAAIGSAGAA
mgnify:CR=1 FL=1